MDITKLQYMFVSVVRSYALFCSPGIACESGCHIEKIKKIKIKGANIKTVIFN